MPLPNMADRRAYHFDVELELRDYDATAASATASETGKAFEVRAIDTAKVVVHHAAIGGTVDESNYWSVGIEVSDLVGGTYTEIANSGPLPATAGQVEVPISGQQASVLDSDSAFIRVTATKTGTTAGNLTYGAYITPC
ncbi:MAG: hypothetical protein AAF810_17315 [Cyanobacteria bacterium P01_D01_bin.36]